MRERKNHSADLLVCFPSRAHLALAPKPICSPARPNESKNRHRNHHRRHVSKLAGSQASPLLWAKTSNKQMGNEISEPTSPKVTCAGQIKVRPRSKCPNPCKSWQSVMEEIERINNSRSQSRLFGFKKDVLNFLTCLRNIRFDFRCFGSFPHADINSDDEAEKEEEKDEEVEENEGEEEEKEEESSRTVFSKWFMVLQENQSNDKNSDDEKNNGYFQKREKKQRSYDFDSIGSDDSKFEPAVPPPNALLLMRCRSAPAKSWLENKKTDEEEKEDENEINKEEEIEEENEKKAEEKKKKKKKDLRSLMEEEKIIQKQNLVVMRYDTNFYKLSADIAKETWIVGGIKNPLARSRSFKR